jgi:hypothetical protein
MSRFLESEYIRIIADHVGHEELLSFLLVSTHIFPPVNVTDFNLKSLAHGDSAFYSIKGGNGSHEKI